VSAKPTKRKSSAIARTKKRTAGLNYHAWSGGIASLLEEARRQSARHVNAILTATYWEIGRRIVEFVQVGEARADYGEEVLENLARDLTKRFGNGFSKSILFQMRGFYLQHVDIFQTLSGKSGAAVLGLAIFQTVSGKSCVPVIDIETSATPPTAKQNRQTASAKSENCGTPSHKFTAPIYATASRKSSSVQKLQTPSAISSADLSIYLDTLSEAFPLSWSHYVRLLSVEQPEARAFYETESLRGGWSVRQLDRQVSTLFYERTALAKNKAKLLTTGAKARPEDAVSVEEEIKSPYVLEFLNLRDDYAESDLEDALVRHLESFLLELGNDFTLVARQKRIRVGQQWYRIDLLLFHRRLRCLFIFDLKLGRFTHADAGQMNLYVNYAAEHLTLDGENPPVGLVLCSERDDAVARYSMGNLTNKILVAQYKLALPDPRRLEKEIEKTRRMLELRAKVGYKSTH